MSKVSKNAVLAWKYYEGKGLRKNFKKAFIYMEASAEEGDISLGRGS